MNPTTIEIVFSRLATRYGSAWLAKWEGLDPEVVAKDWLRVLGGVSLSSIGYAFDHLPPDFPPTAGQFREICLRAPSPPTLALEDNVRPDPLRLVAELRRLQELRKGRKPRDWIRDVQGQIDAGLPVSAFTRTAMREAMKVEREEAAAMPIEELAQRKAETERRVREYRLAHGL